MSAEDLLVIAPHPDDETLGAGGTVARAAAAGMTVTVVTVAAHMPPLYSEAVHAQTLAESRKAQAILGAAEPRYLDIPALSLGEMPVAQLNGAIAEAVGDLRPSVVLCPYPDRHIDHRLIFDAVMVATRPVGAGSGAKVVNNAVMHAEMVILIEAVAMAKKLGIKLDKMVEILGRPDGIMRPLEHRVAERIARNTDRPVVLVPVAD